MNKIKGFTILRVVITVLIIILLSPILFVVLLYELTPYRRNLLFRFECSILSILARNGETWGKELRELACSEIQGSVSGVGFYRIMSSLTERQEVAERVVLESVTVNGKTWSQRKTYYRLTENGRRSRIHRAATTWEIIRGIPQRLAPPEPAES